MRLKKVVSTMMMMGIISIANADVCKETPGSITCGVGSVKKLVGNGMVYVNGTTIEEATVVNGVLTADDAHFFTLNVNGSASLTQCIVNSEANIKGSLKASSSKFESVLDIYSSSTRFINSKTFSNVHIRHIDNPRQEVYLENHSEIGGDIVFDDGNGVVYISGDSKIDGTVIGGKLINK